MKATDHADAIVFNASFISASINPPSVVACSIFPGREGWRELSHGQQCIYEGFFPAFFFARARSAVLDFQRQDIVSAYGLSMRAKGEIIGNESRDL